MASNAPQAQQASALTVFNRQLASGTDQFKKGLPSHISVGKFQRTVLTAVQQNPALLDADRQSLMLSCMKAAQDGLLPDGREAALVIFKVNKKEGNSWVSTAHVQYMPMVYGLRKKILQSGEIADITTGVVYRRELETGAFIFEEGAEATLRHRPMMDLTEEQTADSEIVAAYSVATTKDGFKSYEVMRRFEINRVRQVSQTGAEGKTVLYGADKGKPIAPKGPWVDWFPEQAKKTVMRRHSKTLPMSGDLIDIEAQDDRIAAASSSELLEHQPAPAVPMRSELSDQSFVDLIGAQINGVKVDQETGEVPDEREKVEAKPKAEKKPAAKKADKPAEIAETGPAPDGDEAQPDAVAAEAALSDRIEAQIKAATTALDVSKIMLALPSELSDEATQYLEGVGTKRSAEIRAAAKS